MHICQRARLVARAGLSSRKTPKHADIRPSYVTEGYDERITYLPLSGEVSETRRDTHDECVKVGEFCGLENGIVRLRGRVHLGEDFIRQRLCDPDQTRLDKKRVYRVLKREKARTGRWWLCRQIFRCPS